MARLESGKNCRAADGLTLIRLLPARFRAFLFASFILITISSAAFAANRKATEYEVKAAYLYNFGQFIKWDNAKPTTPSNAFTVCVLGNDPFDGVLDSVVKGGMINGKTVEVKRLSEAEQATGCQILFVSTSEAGRTVKILKTLENTGVLTVSDMAHFCDSGGMIQFVQQGEKIRFEVNLSAANASGLGMSAELLKLAVRVIRLDGGVGA